MAETPVPPPPPPPPPQIVPALKGLFLWIVNSWWFKLLLIVMICALTASFTVRHMFAMLTPDFLSPQKPHLLPKPRKAEDAIGQIRFGNSGCTATIIGPVWNTDETIDILTAAHCVKLGGVGKMSLKDGRSFAVKCVARDPDSDAAWLVANNPGADVPFLLLADEPPQAGEVVWHQGYGIDKPGNRESGIFNAMADAGKKCQFRLSVSPGDSGGGIIVDSEGKVVSPVCCTTKLAGMGTVYGASPARAAKIRPQHATALEEPPLIYPVLPMPDRALSWMPDPPIIRRREPIGDR